MKNRDPKKLALLVGGLVVIAVSLRYFLSTPTKPEITGKAVYYSGPMMNKSRTAYADENGNISKPPAGRPQPDGTNPMAPGTPPGAQADAPKSIDNNQTPAQAGKITD